LVRPPAPGRLAAARHDLWPDDRYDRFRTIGLAAGNKQARKLVGERSMPEPKATSHAARHASNRSADLLAHRTIADLVFHLHQSYRQRENFFTIRRHGRLEAWSAGEMLHKVHALAAAMGVGGINKGDRIALYAENRPEWHVVDFACQLYGAVVVPLFPNLPTEQIAFILSDAGCRWVFYSDAPKRELLEDLSRWMTQPPGLVAMEEAARPERGYTLDQLIKLGENILSTVPLERFAGRVAPEDLSAILYTSGTTGQPKGVMLSHGNLASNMVAASEVYPGPGGEAEQCVCFLPLSHVFARTTCHTFLNLGIALHYVPAVEELPAALAEMKPTVMASVPLVFERAFDRIQQMVDEGAGGKKKIFEWAVGEGQKQLEKRLAGQSGFFDSAKRMVADKLVFKKIQDRFGGRLQMVVSGGAAMPNHIESFFQAVGIGIYQGYGLTETSPLLTINYPGAYKPGSVGVLGKGVEIEIAKDGEILARSPGLMRGYWGRDEATRDAFDERGFFRTGDLGYLDDEGFLFITGRKKDLLVLADGSNVAPVPIEHLLSAAPIIQQAVVVGDGRPHLGALLIPDLDRLGLKGPREQVVQKSEVLEPVREVVKTVNRLLPRHEQIRNFHLLPSIFTVETGELTPTLKVRRPVVLERYRAEIDGLYRGALAF
jgi:long-chain acyl-CoA synthetase